MANTFLLEIVTPTQLVLSEQVDEVTAPGSEGDLGVLTGHAPLLTILKPGKLTYKIGKDTTHITIGAGYAEAGPDRVIILAETISQEAKQG